MTERAYGHAVSKPQLVREYVRHLESRACKLREVRPDERSGDQERELEQIEDKLSKCQTGKQQERQAGLLLNFCGARMSRPHLQTHLSEVELAVSARLTWQAYDSALHLTAFQLR